jgi:sugar phosphate isomerase/epimerase
MKPSSSSFPLSALLTSLPLEFEAAVHQLHALGFDRADVVALSARPEGHREALANTGLLVACAALGRGLPDRYTLEASDVGLRRAAVREVQLHLAGAASLGATHAYLVPGKDASPEGLRRFADACTQLADFAAGRMVRLCIEHIPGRALPSAAAMLAWLEQLAHPNLALLLDIGHCLITQEDPARVVEEAGAHLGYVHLDDNDGQEDLHWPLLTGRLTEPVLVAFLATLRGQGYDGALSLELHSQNPDPVDALRQGKALLQRLAGEPVS